MELVRHTLCAKESSLCLQLLNFFFENCSIIKSQVLPLLGFVPIGKLRYLKEFLVTCNLENPYTSSPQPSLHQKPQSTLKEVYLQSGNQFKACILLMVFT